MWTSAPPPPYLEVVVDFSSSFLLGSAGVIQPLPSYYSSLSSELRFVVTSVSPPYLGVVVYCSLPYLPESGGEP